MTTVRGKSAIQHLTRISDIWQRAAGWRARTGQTKGDGADRKTRTGGTARQRNKGE